MVKLKSYHEYIRIQKAYNQISIMKEESVNELNVNFYKNIGVERLKALAREGGFDTWKDLKVIHDYFKDASSILELGAAYGRCLDYFLEIGFKGKIICVEEVDAFYNYLKEHYHEHITLLKQDIKDLHMNEKVDTAIWMWSGIIDFSREEQKHCVKSIAQYINDNGYLIIDIPRIGFKTFGQHRDDQNLYVETPYGNLWCYIPSLIDIDEYAKEAGFKEIQEIHFETTTNKKRTVYILKK